MKPLFSGLFLSLVLAGCSHTDESALKPSADFIEMEAEGGEAAVFFNDDNWRIDRVINKEGEAAVFGNIYAAGGELTDKNKILTLEVEGALAADWKDKGFVITRADLSALKIDVKENSSGKKFDFVIVVESIQGIQNEIYVTQKQSQGYGFKNMEFSINPEDGDSLFIKEGTRHKFDIQTSVSFSFSPFGGVDMESQSRFESKQQDAFVWTEKDSLTVEIPAGIDDNKLYFSGEKGLYTDIWLTAARGSEHEETVTIPAGQSSFYTEVEYRKRSVSYQLHLVNNRTGADKIIEGKWVEIAPTGKYTVKWE